MEISKYGSNYCFLEVSSGNAACFSYGKLVAAIIDGEYVEFQGEKFYSRTSNKHKGYFRSYYGVEVKK